MHKREEISGMFDNQSSKVIDDIRKELGKGSKLSIASACFSMYAYEALKKELENIEELRFIFTSPTFLQENTPKEKREFYIPKLDREKSLYGSEFEIKLRHDAKGGSQGVRGLDTAQGNL